jgi:hypothetical protein
MVCGECQSSKCLMFMCGACVWWLSVRAYVWCVCGFVCGHDVCGADDGVCLFVCVCACK